MKKIDPDSILWCRVPRQESIDTNCPLKFPLNSRKHLFTVQVSEHWHMLTRVVVISPSMEIFKIHLNVVLGNLLWVSLLEQGLDQMDPHLYHSWILWSAENLYTAFKFRSIPFSWSLIWLFDWLKVCHQRWNGDFTRASRHREQLLSSSSLVLPLFSHVQRWESFYMM